MKIKLPARYFALMGTTYLLLFYSFLQMDLMNSFGEHLIKDFNLNQSQYGLLTSLYFYIDMLLIIPAGICLDRYGPKQTISMALTCALLGLSIFTLYPSYSTAVLWRGLSGVLGSVSVVGPIMLIVRALDLQLIGRTIGGFGLIIMSAGIIAQAPVALMIQHIGMQATLIVDILFGIAVFCVILRMTTAHHREAMNFHREFAIIMQVYLDKKNLSIALFASLINLPIFIFGAGWGNLYLETEHHIAASDVPLILSMVFIGNIVGAILFGYISDRFKNRLFLMQVGSIVYVVSLAGLVLGIASDINLLCVIVFSIGFATGSQTLSYALMTNLNCPTLQGKATSMVSFFSVGFGATIQMICGHIDIFHITTILISCGSISVALALFSNFKADQFSQAAEQARV